LRTWSTAHDRYITAEELQQNFSVVAVSWRSSDPDAGIYDTWITKHLEVGACDERNTHWVELSKHSNIATPPVCIYGDAPIHENGTGNAAGMYFLIYPCQPHLNSKCVKNPMKAEDLEVYFMSYEPSVNINNYDNPTQKTHVDQFYTTLTTGATLSTEFILNYFQFTDDKDWLLETKEKTEFFRPSVQYMLSKTTSGDPTNFNSGWFGVNGVSDFP